MNKRQKKQRNNLIHYVSSVTFKYHWKWKMKTTCTGLHTRRNRANLWNNSTFTSWARGADAQTWPQVWLFPVHTSVSDGHWLRPLLELFVRCPPKSSEEIQDFSVFLPWHRSKYKPATNKDVNDLILMSFITQSCFQVCILYDVLTLVSISCVVKKRANIRKPEADTWLGSASTSKTIGFFKSMSYQLLQAGSLF